MENLPEYKLVADEEGRKAAFTKFVKRQKVCDRSNLYHLLINDLGTSTRGNL
jgi:hypothetical protein